MRNSDQVVILGKRYSIEIVDRPSDVDVYRRESLWGQVDYWSRSIRIYGGERTKSDKLETLLHEILHAIAEELRLKCFNGDRGHDELGMLALALADVMVRNEWVEL